MKHGISADEEDSLIKNALNYQNCISEILAEVQSQKMESNILAKIKEQLLPLQLENWKIWSQSDREMQRIQNDTGKTSIESRLKRLREDMNFARSQQYNYLQNPSKFLVEIFKMIGVCQSDFQQILYFWRVLQSFFSISSV